MSQYSDYRTVFVAEDSDGRPVRSAIDRARLNDKLAVVRYVPVDVVIDVFESLNDGDAESALHVLREVLLRPGERDQ